MPITAFIRPRSARLTHRPKRGDPKPKVFWSVKPMGYNGVMIMPPSTLGFSSLVEPDPFGDHGPKFKGDAHFTQTQAEALSDMMDAKVCTKEAFEALKVELAKSGKDDVVAKIKLKTAGVWLEESLKEPKEKSTIKLPYLTIACNASVKNKDGSVKPTVIRATSATGLALDLPSLNIGRGSIVQFIVQPSLWHGSMACDFEKKKPVAWWAVPALRLVGLRVLKLEQYAGGSGASIGAVTEGELVGVEAGFEPEDLASFAQGRSQPTPSSPREELDTGITTDGPEEF